MASRAEEVIRAYRQGLRLARSFPDACGRAYLTHRIMALFRRRQGEVSTARVSRHLHEARKAVRRMGRAVAGDVDDTSYILELAHGKRGRFMHLLKSYECTARPLPPVPEPLPRWGARPGVAGGGGRGGGWGCLSLVPGAPAYRRPVQHTPSWETRHIALIRAATGAMPQEVADMSRRRRRIYQDVFDLSPPRLRIWTELDGEGGTYVRLGHRRRVLRDLGSAWEDGEHGPAAAAERGLLPALGPPETWPRP